MMAQVLWRAALPLAILLPSGQAFAQATPGIEDAISRGTQIDEGLRSQQRVTPRPDDPELGEIDGEAGVYVMTVNDIFYVGVSAGVGWSENPARTSDDLGDSAFGTAALTAGMQTRLGGKIDAGLSATVSGIEYDANIGPSSRTVTGALNLGSQIGQSPFYVGLSAFGGGSFDQGFKNGTSFYGANLALSAGVPLGPRTIVRGTLAGGRQEGEITENNAWNANLSFDLNHAVSQEVTVGASGRVSRVWFDDFFEDVTFVERKDWQYGGNVNASYAPTDWLAISASVGYEKRDSAFFLSSYDGFEASLVLSARKRF